MDHHRRGGPLQGRPGYHRLVTRSRISSYGLSPGEKPSMLTSNERKDYILRMIAELRRMVEAILGKLRDGENADELLARARESTARLLGPMGGVAPRMDSVTAAQMV